MKMRGEGKKMGKLRRERGGEEKLSKNWVKNGEKPSPSRAHAKKWENAPKAAPVRPKLAIFTQFLVKIRCRGITHCRLVASMLIFRQFRNFEIFPKFSILRDFSQGNKKFYIIKILLYIKLTLKKVNMVVRLSGGKTREIPATPRCDPF